MFILLIFYFSNKIIGIIILLTKMFVLKEIEHSF